MSALKAVALLIVVLLPAVFIHRVILSWQGVSFQANDYAPGYGLNFIMAAIIIVVLLRLPERYKSSLGYFFMFGSFLKFIVYFLVFLPLYKADGSVSKAEFFLFFIPYLVCLVIETSVLIFKLNREN